MLDFTQFKQQKGDDRPPPPPMMRIHNPATGVQVLTTEEKAARLITEGTFREGASPVDGAGGEKANRT